MSTSFRDLLVWQQSRALTSAIYAETATWKDFGLRGQIQRAAVSVMSNIAEGCSRRSDREFGYFLRVSLGSCAEVSSLLTVATDIGYLSESRQQDLQELASSISRLTTQLKKSMA